MDVYKDKIDAVFNIEDGGFPLNAYLTKKWGVYPNYFAFIFCKEAIELFMEDNKEKEIIHQGIEEGHIVECTLKISEHIYVLIISRADNYSIRLYYEKKTTEVIDYLKYMKEVSDKTKKSGTIGVLCFDGSFYIEEKQINNTPIDLTINYNDV